MARPKIETAALRAPGGSRIVGDPPDELVRLLADWLNSSESTARAVLDRLGWQR